MKLFKELLNLWNEFTKDLETERLIDERRKYRLQIQKEIESLKSNGF